MNQLITPVSLAQETQDAEAIVESIRASLFELPGAVAQPGEPRFLDIEDFLDPPRPSSAMQDVIAVRWKERLSRLTTFQRRLRQYPRWQHVQSRFLGRTDELTRGLFSVSDPRRKVFAKLAAYLSDEEMRVALLTEIDLVTQKETAALMSRAMKHGGRLDGFPLIVVGAGVHGANAALVLQAFAAGRVLTIDAGPRRGGLFRTFTPLVGTDYAVFETNSRDTPWTPNQRIGSGSLRLSNAFFDQAPIQPAAIARSSFLGDHLLAAATAVNSYLAGPSIQGGHVSSTPGRKSLQDQVSPM